MFVANKLRRKYHNEEYKSKKYRALETEKDPAFATMPDPGKVKLRVYSRNLPNALGVSVR
jgi:hypothetical protein